MTDPRFMTAIFVYIFIDKLVIAFFEMGPPIATYFQVMFSQHVFDTIQTDSRCFAGRIQHLGFINPAIEYCPVNSGTGMCRRQPQAGASPWNTSKSAHLRQYFKGDKYIIQENYLFVGLIA
ncbi:hypothetical protein [Microbulbifer magnicolonia]|uniref:hypothetical protein n=1 Tax=Microbulbifer magnicolonia TaxID=3109744 RepID=UPI002B402973|nr:hypothetical protein [Microbulbifer sp. GG15]